jgi:F-type H+-transporting ATPase subunit delta
MRDVVVASKYARALFEETRVRGNGSRVGSELFGLLDLDETSHAFIAFLASPEIPTDQKLVMLEKVFENRVDPLLKDFLRLLIEKGRIVLIREIAKVFRELIEEAQGLLRAQVDTAAPLGPDQEARLKAELDRITGKQVILEKRVDPTILGGVVIHLGHRIIDRSLRRGLWSLGESLRHAQVN